MVIPSITLCIRQPWAFLVVNGFKPIENRTWPLPDRFIGQPILIQASKRPTFSMMDAQREICRRAQPEEVFTAAMAGLGTGTGGIVGVTTVRECIQGHRSIWAEPNTWNWILSDSRPLPFMACRGRLGLFKVEYPHTEAINV
jgi:hypothetical protein